MYTEYQSRRLPAFRFSLLPFYRWGRQYAHSFPSFRQPEDYYGHCVFRGSIRVPERSLSYHTQFD